jgi:hypothetical protein
MSCRSMLIESVGVSVRAMVRWYPRLFVGTTVSIARIWRVVAGVYHA